MLDKYARPQDRDAEDRSQALVRAYMSSNFGDPSFFAGGGQFEKKGLATARALARLAYQVSGASDAVGMGRNIVQGRPPLSGDSGMILSAGGSGTFGTNPKTALATKAFTNFMDEYALPVRSEAGRTGRAMSVSDSHHQSIPPIATSKDGVPLAAFPEAPRMENYLGDDTIKLMMERVGIASQPNANRLTSGMISHGVDPMDLPLRRSLKEAMADDLYTTDPDETLDAAQGLQSLLDRTWMRQRGDSVTQYNYGMRKADELQQRGEEFKDAPIMGQLARRMLETAAKRREFERSRHPYLIPDRVAALLQSGARGTG